MQTLDPTVRRVLERVADTVDARAGRPGHSAAVARCAGQLAAAMGLDDDERSRVELAARLHDVQAIDGPAGPAPGPGAAVLRALLPEGVAALVAAHGERFDGTGQPRGLAGEAIALGARIVAAADACAALVATDPERWPGWLPESTARELGRRAGAALDPAVVATLLALGAQPVSSPRA